MKYFITFILFLLPLIVFSQQVKFTAIASSEEVEVGSQFSISYTIEGADFSGFKPPEFENLQFLGRGSFESRSISASGDMQVKKTFTFYLAALRSGTYTIEPATLNVRNRLFTSNPITIKVTDGSAGAATSPSGINEGNLPKENVFIRAYLDKDEAFVGEQVLLTYKLFTRYNIRNYTPPTTNYNGFWKKDVSISRPQLQREIVNGSTYNTTILHQVILFPQVAGERQLEPAEMTASVEVDFFRTRSMTLESNSTSIKIKPLPDQGKPESFSGAVGNFNVTANASSTSITTDDPLTISVKIDGTGNLSLLEAPKLNLPESWTVYDPEVSENISIQSGKLTGSKTFNFLIIPDEPGILPLHNVEFSFFNPQLKRYITKTATLPEVTVTQGTGKVTAKAGSDGNMPELMTGDVNFYNKTDNFTSSPFFYTLLALPFLIFLPLFYYKKNKDTKESDIVLTRNTLARKKFNGHMDKAKAAIDINDQKLFYGQLLKAIQEFLLHKFNLPVSQHSKSQIEAELISKNIDKTTIEELLLLINKGEAAVYAPAAPIADIKKDFEATHAVVNKL